MVKEFAKLKFNSQSVSENDLALIQDNPFSRECFYSCQEELSQMVNIKFYPPHSYYSILKKSISMKKLSNLTKNQELVSQFEKNLKSFSFYRDDLYLIIHEAIRLKDQLEAVVYHLNSIFNDFLPAIVIELLAENLTIEDLPSE